MRFCIFSIHLFHVNFIHCVSLVFRMIIVNQQRLVEQPALLCMCCYCAFPPPLPPSPPWVVCVSLAPPTWPNSPFVPCSVSLATAQEMFSLLPLTRSWSGSFIFSYEYGCTYDPTLAFKFLDASVCRWHQVFYFHSSAKAQLYPS